MKILFILLGLLLVSSFFLIQKPTLNSDRFVDYQVKFSKKYLSADEEAYRMRIFYENLDKIEIHNADRTQTYTEGVNQFTDLTQEEFELIYLGELPQYDYYPHNLMETNSENFEDIDWTEKKAVSDIKNQGACGSCWAFGTTGSLESLNYIFGSKKMVEYSEQQLVDCAWDYGCYGCSGGLRDKAMMYVIDHGITTEKEYPYEAKDGDCRIDKGDFKISNYGSVAAGSCDDLGTALDKQPVSVGVDASRWSAYKDGIFSNCGTSINHGVLLVAVKQGKNGDGFWKIKNSWGKSWGEKGFIRLAYPGSTCAVCNRAYYPIL